MNAGACAPNDRQEPVLTARDITVVKGERTILDVREISVAQGETLAAIGPNGAGKSTLLSVMALLTPPTTGHVLYEGKEVTKRNALSVRRQMAVVFQEPLLLDGTVMENVTIGLHLRGRKQGAEDTARLWLERFGISHLSSQLSHTLSGGEAQRASLARAFALSPQVLFLDEPFASVDAISRQSLIDRFKDILTLAGTTTVLVTHDFKEVLALATRVIVLWEGRIQDVGTPLEILGDPRWQALAGLSAGLS